jgi:methyltransferase family protein
VDFATYALSQLPAAPARVLEIGCGEEGGVTPALVDAGYDTLAVDPRAPDGARYRRMRFQDLADESYDAVVAERVLHHVHPLGESLDKLSALAPLLVLDEFAWDRIDEPTREWYEAQHRALRANGAEPGGPPELETWRAKWTDLHPADVLRRALVERYDELLYEPRPYLYRWLGGGTMALEAELVAAGAIRPIGFRWVGVRRSSR